MLLLVAQVREAIQKVWVSGTSEGSAARWALEATLHKMGAERERASERKKECDGGKERVREGKREYTRIRENGSWCPLNVTFFLLA